MTRLLRMLRNTPCTCVCVMCRMANHRDCRFTHDRRCHNPNAPTQFTLINNHR